MVGSAIPGQVGLLLYNIAEQIRGSKPMFLPLGSCLGFPQGWILSQINTCPLQVGFHQCFSQQQKSK